jgi:RNAse (barnase) inhibitor barstar
LLSVKVLHLPVTIVWLKMQDVTVLTQTIASAIYDNLAEALRAAFFTQTIAFARYDSLRKRAQ